MINCYHWQPTLQPNAILAKLVNKALVITYLCWLAFPHIY